jgi:transforming growth factor-beta-induced protein
MKISFNIQTVLFLACFLIVTSCAQEFKQVDLATGKTITQTASESSDFNILVAALTKTGLSNSFANNNAGAFTVFAPTDDAFVAYFNSLPASSLPPGTVAAGAFDEASVLAAINLLAAVYSPAKATALTPASLSNTLLYHIVSSDIPSAKVIGAQGFITLSGSARLSVSKVGANVVLNANKLGYAPGNGATSVVLDIKASNGTIHSIDKVLIPVATNNIWIGTNSGTVVNLPNFVVNYGVSPPAVSIFGVVMPRKAAPDGTINVATAATGTVNDYNILSAAIVRAELAPVIFTITTPFPDFTLFAPTDAAFIAYLGVADEAAAIAMINGLAPSVLTEILKYHIIAGRVVTTDLADGQAVTTLLAGKIITVGISGNTVTLKDGNAAADPTFSLTSAGTNFLTNAGVVHQINAVLRSN